MDLGTIAIGTGPVVGGGVPSAHPGSRCQPVNGASCSRCVPGMRPSIKEGDSEGADICCFGCVRPDAWCELTRAGDGDKPLPIVNSKLELGHSAPQLAETRA